MSFQTVEIAKLPVLGVKINVQPTNANPITEKLYINGLDQLRLEKTDVVFGTGLKKFNVLTFSVSDKPQVVHQTIANAIVYEQYTNAISKDVVELFHQKLKQLLKAAYNQYPNAQISYRLSSESYEAIVYAPTQIWYCAKIYCQVQSENDKLSLVAKLLYQWNDNGTKLGFKEELLEYLSRVGIPTNELLITSFLWRTTNPIVSSQHGLQAQLQRELANYATDKVKEMCSELSTMENIIIHEVAFPQLMSSKISYIQCSVPELVTAEEVDTVTEITFEAIEPTNEIEQSPSQITNDVEIDFIKDVEVPSEITTVASASTN